MRRLRSWVHLTDEDGTPVSFGPDDVVPDWAADQITNPKAWAVNDEAAAEAADSSDGPPPKNGRGSGTAAWATYAESVGLTVPEDAGRDEIIELVEHQ